MNSSSFGSSIIAQVLTGYETLGLNIPDIASQLNLEEDAVSYILQTHSAAYRESLPKDKQEAAATNRYDELIRKYEQLATYTKNDTVKEKALARLIDEERGRNDVGLEMIALKKRQLSIASSQEERLKKFNTMILEMANGNKVTLTNGAPTKQLEESIDV